MKKKLKKALISKNALKSAALNHIINFFKLNDTDSFEICMILKEFQNGVYIDTEIKSEFEINLKEKSLNALKIYELIYFILRDAAKQTPKLAISKPLLCFYLRNKNNNHFICKMPYSKQNELCYYGIFRTFDYERIRDLNEKATQALAEQARNAERERAAWVEKCDKNPEFLNEIKGDAK